MEASQLRRLEQQRWLDKHAHKSIANAQSLHIQSGALLKGLLAGVRDLKDPPLLALLELKTNLHFAKAAPISSEKPRGFKYNEARLATSGVFNSSMQRIREYDTAKRWDAGVNGMTLLTEYRRKLIFHAMLASGDVLEERSSAREKLDAYLHLYAPELLDSTGEGEEKEEEEDSKNLRPTLMTLPPLLSPSPPNNKGDRKKNPKEKEKKKKKTRQEETNFSPLLGDYDTMRNRWRFIQPQIRDFSNALTTNLMPPTNGDRCVSLGKDLKVRGTYSDALIFVNQTRSVI